MKIDRTLANLLLRQTLPTYDTMRLIDVYLATRLTAYRARRPLDLATTDAKAPGAAPGQEAGEHEPLANPPFDTRLADLVEPAGERDQVYYSE